jgi:Flp pilus assembly secretin CpaC
MSIKAGLAAALLLLVSAGTALAAGGPVTVRVNMASIYRLDVPASTVVVGNPAVADVTIQDPRTLILTGKSYGQTNLIVLNQRGDRVLEVPLEVVQDTANTVTIFSAGVRSTVACAPDCAPTVMVGDSVGYTQELTSSMAAVSAAATQ